MESLNRSQEPLQQQQQQRDVASHAEHRASSNSTLPSSHVSVSSTDVSRRASDTSRGAVSADVNRVSQGTADTATDMAVLRSRVSSLEAELHQAQQQVAASRQLQEELASSHPDVRALIDAAVRREQAQQEVCTVLHECRQAC